MLRVDENCKIIRCENFPKSFKKSSAKYQVTLGIGGNVGDVKSTFDKLFKMLHNDKSLYLYKTSFLYKNPPFGYLEQDDFLNGIIVLNTNLNVKQFFKKMMRYELKLGRKRSFKDAPRTLDIDLIFFGDMVMDSEKLTIPHPHWYKRDSVTVPLKSIR